MSESTNWKKKTGKDIQHIKQEINDIKGDFATTFVLREDFFRSMNGVEDKIKGMDNKLDRLLLMGKEKISEVRNIDRHGTGRDQTEQSNQGIHHQMPGKKDLTTQH